MKQVKKINKLTSTNNFYIIICMLQLPQTPSPTTATSTRRSSQAFCSQSCPKCSHIFQKTESEMRHGHFLAWQTTVRSFHNACMPMNVNKPL